MLPLLLSPFYRWLTKGLDDLNKQTFRIRWTFGLHCTCETLWDNKLNHLTLLGLLALSGSSFKNQYRARVPLNKLIKQRLSHCLSIKVAGGEWEYEMRQERETPLHLLCNANLLQKRIFIINSLPSGDIIIF